MSPALNIATKDLRVLLRDRPAAFFTFIFPIIFAVLFGAIFSGAGGDANVPVAVVDLDQTESSAAFVEQLSESGGLELRIFQDADSADAAVLASGGPVAAIIIEPGFADAIDDPFGNGGAGGTGVAGGEADQSGIGGVRLRADPSRAAEVALVEGVTRGAAFGVFFQHASKPETTKRWLDAAPATVIQPGRRAVLAELLNQGNSDASGAGDGVAFEPVEITNAEVLGTRVRPTAFGLTFPQGAAWGLMACVTGFGVSLADERKRGTLARMISAGVSNTQVVLGKSIAAFIACLLVLALLQTIAWVAFGVRTGRPELLVVTDISIAACFVGIMMLLANLARSVGGSEGLVRAILLTLALVGGAGVPLFFMPGWMQHVSLMSPFRWAIVAIENATWRAATWSDSWQTLAMLLAMGGVSLALGLALFSRTTQTRTSGGT